MPEIVFKKVDSRLKGHVADEVAVLAGTPDATRALVAPAIPVQGRVVADGRLTGAGVAAPIDVAAAVGDGRPRALKCRTPAPTPTSTRRSVATLDGPPPLLVGAAGLAAALARRIAAGAWSMPAPRLTAPSAARDRLARSDHPRPGRAAGRDRKGDDRGGAGRGLSVAGAGMQPVSCG